MNRIHRLVWNHVLQAWVVASELSPRRGKRSGTRGAAALLASVLVAPGAFAVPASNPVGEACNSANADRVVAIGTGSAGCNASVDTDRIKNPLFPNAGSPGLSQIFGTAVGRSATAPKGGTAFGDYASAVGDHAAALGSLAHAGGRQAVAIGLDAFASGDSAIAMGARSVASASGATAQGGFAQATGNNSLASGYNVLASGTDSIALGLLAQSEGNQSIAMGSRSLVKDAGAIAIGANAGTDDAGARTNAVALGFNAKSSGADALSLGANTSATTNAVALGANSVADRADTVSIGRAGNERQLTNVRDGTAGTDAVNKNQLDAVDGRISANTTAIGAANARIDTTNINVTALTGRVDTNETAISGLQTRADDALYYDAADKKRLTLGGVGAGDAVRVSNVADATDDDDAVNLAQLNTVDGRVTTNAADIDAANTRIDTTNTNVNALTGRVDTNEIAITGLQTRADGALYYDAADKKRLTLGGVGAGDAVRVSNVADGTDDDDAVNLAQLNTVDDRVTTNAADIDAANTRIDTTNTNVMDLTGRVDANETAIDATNTDVTALTGRVGTNETAITGLQTRADGALYYDAADKRQVTFGGVGAADAVRLSNVATGTADTDAVNKKQLDDAIDGVAAGAASPYLAVDGANDGSDDASIGTTTNAVALGANSVATRDDSVSIGSTGNERQLTNLAAGTADTDAVNVAQLNTVDGRVTTNATAITDANGRIDTTNTNVMDLTDRVDANEAAIDTTNTDVTALTGRVGTNETAITGLQTRADGALYYDAADKAQVTLGGAGAAGPVRIANVAAGVAGSDAVNVDQLKAVADDIGDGSQNHYLVADGAYDGSDKAGTVGTTNAVAIGANAVADRENSVSFGHSGGERQLTHVAAGTANTDAVNVKQLTDAIDGVAAGAINPYLVVDGANDGSDNARTLGTSNAVAIGANSVADRENSVSVGAAGNERVITNVAAGTDDTDAVNVGQLKDAGVIDPGTGRVRDMVAYDTGSAMGQITLAGAAGTRITNLRDGDIRSGSTDAVNGGQIAEIRDHLQGQIDGLVGGGPHPGDPNPGPGPGVGGDEHFDAEGDTGKPAQASGIGSVAAGEGAAASGSKGTAVGSNSTASGANSTALGADSTASASNAVALGNGSVADRADSVSVGSEGHERQITNVKAGTARTDAVNVGQLQDAMASANQYADDRFDVMKDMLDQNSRQANRGIAASAALVNNMPYAPGKVVLNAGVAGYRGESAMGISASRWSDNGRVNINVGVSQARKDQPIIRFGVGFVFGD